MLKFGEFPLQGMVVECILGMCHNLKGAFCGKLHVIVLWISWHQVIVSSVINILNYSIKISLTKFMAFSMFGSCGKFVY